MTRCPWSFHEIDDDVGIIDRCGYCGRVVSIVTRADGEWVIEEHNLPAGEPTGVGAACQRCGKTWVNGTCDDTVSRRARCATVAHELS